MHSTEISGRNYQDITCLCPLQASSRLLNTRNALSTMLADIPASIRMRISQLNLTIDILTLLLDIICPKLRPVRKSICYKPGA